MFINIFLEEEGKKITKGNDLTGMTDLSEDTG